MQTLQTPRNASDTSNLHSFTAGNYEVASHDNQFVRYNHRTAAKLHFIWRTCIVPWMWLSKDAA